LQDALGPDAGIRSVAERLAKPFSFQILRRADAAPGVDEDGRVAEKASGEDRNGDERRIVKVERAQIIGESQFGYVEFLVLDHPLKNLGHEWTVRRRTGRLSLLKFQLYACRLYLSINKRLGAIVGFDCDREFEHASFLQRDSPREIEKTGHRCR
jgi:hypothetical protein